MKLALRDHLNTQRRPAHRSLWWVFVLYLSKGKMKPSCSSFGKSHAFFITVCVHHTLGALVKLRKQAPMDQGTLCQHEVSSRSSCLLSAHLISTTQLRGVCSLQKNDSQRAINMTFVIHVAIRTMRISMPRCSIPSMCTDTLKCRETLRRGPEAIRD